MIFSVKNCRNVYVIQDGVNVFANTNDDRLAVHTVTITFKLHSTTRKVIQEYTWTDSSGKTHTSTTHSVWTAPDQHCGQWHYDQVPNYCYVTSVWFEWSASTPLYSNIVGSFYSTTPFTMKAGTSAGATPTWPSGDITQALHNLTIQNIMPKYPTFKVLSRSSTSNSVTYRIVESRLEIETV